MFYKCGIARLFYVLGFAVELWLRTVRWWCVRGEIVSKIIRDVSCEMFRGKSFRGATSFMTYCLS